ncbi:outer membrane protein assembly factor BamA [Candidatus Pelagibacter communis]|uniref:outer membrane protein assembly factor BamA n=1 Tax=Pelagibacter ubique TaxID=198252 RepID=UPI00094CB1E1|nr:outer membrane protein assembly factor BamA [Candidatus Pelagibacter ubique]
MNRILLSLLFFAFFISVRAEIINDIKLENNIRVSKESIISFGNIKLGTDYSESDVNQILLDLYETNFFSDIKLKIENNILIISVKEKKIIQTVSIEGVKSKENTEKILKNLRLKDKSPFDKFTAEQDLNRIKDSLSRSGYYFAKVDVTIKENSNDTVDLIYNIDTGEKALIKNIKFTGDKFYKDKKLRSVIVSEENKFWKFISNKKYLDVDRIELDKRLLKNFYLNKGYYNVEIESSSAIFNNNFFELIYNINSGNKYFIKNAKLNIPLDYKPKDFSEIKKTIDKLKGRKYSLNEINKVIKEIDKISVSRLYDFIDATIEVDEIDENKLDLVFTIIESDKFFVNRINIFGNNITEEKVIRNQLEVDEGDPFNKLLHAKSINNLKALRIFADVKDEVVSIENSQQKNIKITVEEKPTGEILASAGVGNDGGTVGFSVSEKNFMGRGIGLVSSLSLSEERIKGEFTVNNPNFNYTDKSLSTSIFAIDTDKMTESGYQSGEVGFSFGTSFEQYDNLFFSPSFKTVAEKLETNSLASTSIKKQEGNYFTSTIGYAFDYDLRNQKYQTSDGFRSKFFQTLPVISDSNTITSGYFFDKYLTISETTASVGFFLKNAVGLSDDVRVSERVGLPRKRLRGFKSGRIGPVDAGDDHVGGNYAAALSITTNLPYIAPTLQNFEFNYFLDFGNVWGTDYRASNFDDSNFLRISTGAGIEWFTPVGPLNLTFSHALQKKDTDEFEGFQFNIGTTF